MNYAVITKAKAMYGKRLTGQDFKTLSEMKNVEDCAQFLKAHPAFEKTLGTLDIRGIHRGQLEKVLYSQYYLDFTRLIKGLTENDRKVVSMFFKAYETGAVLWFLRNLNAPEIVKGGYISLYEPMMKKHTELDFSALHLVKTVKQLISILPPRYASVIERATDNDGNFDYISIENELWKNYYLGIGNTLKKKSKDEDVRTIFGIHTDLRNIINIFRLREYFNYSANEIIPFVMRPSYRLTDEVLQRFCNAANKKEFATILADTPYSALKDAVTNDGIEFAAAEIVCKKACKLLHFSKSAPAVVYAYTEYKQREINKVKTVVESVRYNLDREMIESYVGTKTKAD